MSTGRFSELETVQKSGKGNMSERNMSERTTVRR